MISDNSILLDFDGVLTAANGRQVNVSCNIRTPQFSGDTADIAVWLPHKSCRQYLENPCTVTGQDRLGRSVSLRGVSWKEMNWELGRETGLSPMIIAHIDQLEITHSGSSRSVGNLLAFFLGDHVFLRKTRAQKALVEGSIHTEEIFTLKLPGIGRGRFVREWKFWRKPDQLTATGGCVLRCDMLNADQVSRPLNAQQIRTALVVPSILMRQRLSVNGWCESTGAGETEAWYQPLAPIRTEHKAVMPEDYLVSEIQLAEIANEAMDKFESLPSDIRRVIEYISLGLVPYIAQRHGERFLALFYALEACRKFASKEPGEETLRSTDELITLLAKASNGASPVVSARVEGIVSNIRSGPKVDLRIQLEEVLLKWNVECANLWPIVGTDGQPGLKNIRDRLSHKGGTSVNSDSLIVATHHLSILMERVVIALLGIPLEKTAVSLEKVKRDSWCDYSYIQHERRRIFSEPDWA